MHYQDKNARYFSSTVRKNVTRIRLSNQQSPLGQCHSRPYTAALSTVIINSVNDQSRIPHGRSSGRTAIFAYLEYSAGQFFSDAHSTYG